MNESFAAVIARLESRHQGRFTAPIGVDHLIRYWSFPRVEVSNSIYGRVRRGRISITTGPHPALMLMPRKGVRGSSDLLGPDDRVTAIIDKRGQRHPVE